MFFSLYLQFFFDKRLFYKLNIYRNPNKMDTVEMLKSVIPADWPQCLQVLVGLNTGLSDTLRTTTKW